MGLEAILQTPFYKFQYHSEENILEDLTLKTVNSYFNDLADPTIHIQIF